jgi:hypothetical protein
MDFFADLPAEPAHEGTVYYAAWRLPEDDPKQYRAGEFCFAGEIGGLLPDCAADTDIGMGRFLSEEELGVANNFSSIDALNQAAQTAGLRFILA